MPATVEGIHSLDDLRHYVHRVLCQRENLVAEQFQMREFQLQRNGRACGLQFSLQGPRNVRLGAIWDADYNVLYFYDAGGNRFKKEPLPARILCPAA